LINTLELFINAVTRTGEWYDAGMKQNKGFTLVEILVVIAIIGILSSIVLASMGGARAKGRDTKRISDVKQLQLALQLYYDGHDSKYPQDIDSLTDDNFISSIPLDPLSPDQDYVYAPTSCSSSLCTTYSLTAELETTGSVYDGDPDCSDVDTYCVTP